MYKIAFVQKNFMRTFDENWRVFDFIINYLQYAFESCSRLLINMTRKPYKIKLLCNTNNVVHR